MIMAKITLENGMAVEGTAAELVEIAKALENKVDTETTFEVGDLVKVLSEGSYGGIDIGEIGRIAKELDADGEYRVDALNELYHDYFKPSQLENATEDEIDQAKAEAERKQVEAKWAKIGRKVDEFKKGDIVRVLKEGVYKYYSSHNHGDIGTVVEGDGTERPLIEVNGIEQYSVVELVTPVEVRFDR